MVPLHPEKTREQVSAAVSRRSIGPAVIPSIFVSDCSARRVDLASAGEGKYGCMIRAEGADILALW